MQEETFMLLDILPSELQEEIWMWLPPQDLFKQQLICLSWRDQFLHDSLWQRYHRR